ncbi:MULTISPECIES: hypothetical protein [unclassified Campylobacter]|uniref:hypothetical protein n=1 Tax=unclassified Campylobacter TaxID=2593542 RepID=UPI0022E9EEDD|nr:MULTISPECIES: hypothetical protein [unclassified Campylobacter]MDA3056344.1 hypothetical protein [Campylobacter sp. CN_NA1]MDA3065525.1 hypothetical protein [Campylobacter sp. CN_NE4]MDA3068857.1 hypothetical protein [Campylobacter sp. CN_NE3]MDA3082978.1 hypothetical protein [Campylobacter sp. CN_EL2]MDA3084442.1 hypothetical protein [Campylobacter sp. CN_NE1]
MSKTKQNLQISTPNLSEAQKYIKSWNNDKENEHYRVQEKALNQLFQAYSENTDLIKILLKSAALNDFYSTNIFSIYEMAKHIKELKIDESLQKGDANLVNKIAKIKIKEKERNFYSFASKYCSFHNPDEFPIYDSYVAKILLYFDKKDKFSKFSQNDLKNYPTYKNAIFEFRKFYDLEEFSIKKLDQYLWLLGKEKFNKFK